MFGGDGYVGTTEDALRIARLNKKRDKEKEQFEAQRKEAAAKEGQSRLVGFMSSTSEVVDRAFANETVGLQTREQYAEKRANIEKEVAQERELRRLAAEERELRQLQKRRSQKRVDTAKLSFGDEAEEEEEEEEATGADGGAKKLKFSTCSKDPTVPTDFLPDRDREREERAERERLKEEWLAEQARRKAEPLDVTYSYWDGMGHRRTITVKKGDTIGQFLRAVRDQCMGDFRELRSASVDGMLYIKEDLIIPSNLTFLELIDKKARGKSGPICDFTVHDDIRVTNDGREKQEVRRLRTLVRIGTRRVCGTCGALHRVTRERYEKNKHIFPASRWEVFEFGKDYGGYTIYGPGTEGVGR